MSKENGNNLLHCCAINDTPIILRYLLDTLLNSGTLANLLTAHNHHNPPRTPLWEALKRRHKTCIKHLVTAGADCYSSETKQGPLAWREMMDCDLDEKTMDWLMERVDIACVYIAVIADPTDKDAQDLFQKTPFDIKTGRLGAFKLPDIEGVLKARLQEAIGQGDVEMLRVIVRNIARNYKYTPCVNLGRIKCFNGYYTPSLYETKFERDTLFAYLELKQRHNHNQMRQMADILLTAGVEVSCQTVDSECGGCNADKRVVLIHLCFHVVCFCLRLDSVLVFTLPVIAIESSPSWVI